jgi:hypothetical protein
MKAADSSAVGAVPTDKLSTRLGLNLNPPKNKGFGAYEPLSIREKCPPTWENGG